MRSSRLRHREQDEDRRDCQGTEGPDDLRIPRCPLPDVVSSLERCGSGGLTTEGVILAPLLRAAATPKTAAATTAAIAQVDPTLLSDTDTPTIDEIPN
jgi:hypothetical protein